MFLAMNLHSKYNLNQNIKELKHKLKIRIAMKVISKMKQMIPVIHLFQEHAPAFIEDIIVLLIRFPVI